MTVMQYKTHWVIMALLITVVATIALAYGDPDIDSVMQENFALQDENLALAEENAILQEQLHEKSLQYQEYWFKNRDKGAALNYILSQDIDQSIKDKALAISKQNTWESWQNHG